jgi:EAL domain-containing protein (putative c-di-GMP-specific phosphodiesterase class I)
LISRTRANLCFEITETAVIDNPHAALSALDAFRKCGVKISVDDFGSGLSSLSYLKQIAPDELKVDRSLVSDLVHSQRDRKILKSTIDLAHSLRMSVVIEGVEDEQTYAVVSAMGGDSVQGYLLLRPGPLSDLAERFFTPQDGQGTRGVKVSSA